MTGHGTSKRQQQDSRVAAVSLIPLIDTTAPGLAKACDGCAKLCSLGQARGSIQFSSAAAKAMPSKAFGEGACHSQGRKDLAAKVQFHKARKEAATSPCFRSSSFHVLDPTLAVRSRSPARYLLARWLEQKRRLSSVCPSNCLFGTVAPEMEPLFYATKILRLCDPLDRVVP